MRKEWVSLLESFFCSCRTTLFAAAGLNKNAERLFRGDAHATPALGVLHPVCTGGETLLENYSKDRL